jgi:hypothetical protein
MNWWNAILPVVTLILGYFGTLWTEERRDARALSRAQSERAELAVLARADRRETFELETLARAHAALGDFGRAVGRVDHLDSMSAKETGEYGSAPLPDDASETLRAANRALSDAKGLILDDELREAVAVAQTKGNLTSAMRGADPIAVEAVRIEGVTALVTAGDLISARIREIYKGSVTTS